MQPFTRLAAVAALLPALLAGFIAPASAADPVATLERFNSELDTLRADFEQVVFDEAGEAVQRSSGTVELRRPGRFRWLYETPYEQWIVADGETLWIYDADLEQVTRKPMDDALGSAPIGLLMERRPLRESFRVESGGEARGMAWAVLRPRDKETDFDSIRMGFRGDELAVMELRDAFGRLTRIRFAGLVMNPGIPAAHFDFQPPEGTDVVDARR